MLHKLAIVISKTLYDSLNDEKKLQHQKNGLDYKNLENRIKVLLIYFSLFVLLLIVGLTLHIERELFWGTLVFAIARIWNGGHHFESTDLCFLVTATVLLLIQVFNYYFSEYAPFLALVSFLLNAIFAPFHHKKGKTHFYFKKAVSLLACVASLWMGTLVIFAIFAQSIDLIHKPKAIK
ncbi:MAG: accessory gene regulator B family protein [Paenibacillaceae bacterium]